MLRKTRIVAFAATLAAVGAMSVTAAPASAGNFQPSLFDWVVTGSLTAKNLNQKVTLPKGSVFNGSADLELLGLENIHGTLTGTVTVPPFETTLTLLGIPTPLAVGITFNQSRPAVGRVDSTSSANCGGRVGCLTLSVPTKANIAFTKFTVNILGIKIPTHCETSEPINLDLRETLTFLELIGEPGPRFKGTATIPSITCQGLEGIVLGPVMTLALSGPGNPYEINISPPPPPKKKPPKK